MEWKFGQLDDAQSRVNPNLDEFFCNQQEALRHFSESFIREDIQNRLDAKPQDANPADRVRVRYFLSTSGERSQEKIAKWFNGLEEHCNSKHCLESLFSGPRKCFNEKLRYLTIECFNTTGLSGDPSQFNEGTHDLRTNDFYWMFRNVGRSGKAKLHGKRGSWGIGKVVYHMASDIMAFMCYSVTKDRFTLMGKAQLVPHWIDGTGYCTDGFFATFGKKNVPMPLEDITSSDARQFKTDFGITRKDNECGTSTVVPFCVKELTMQDLAISAIRSYLWEILNGRVRIEIQADDGSPDVILEEGSVKDDIKRFFPTNNDDEIAERDKYLAFVDFYDTIISARRGNAKLPSFSLSVPQNMSSALGDVKSLFANSLDFENAKNAYKAGEIVAITANVQPRLRTSTGKTEPQDASFKVYLQNDEMSTPQVSLIRDGLTILSLSGHRDALLRALTLVDSESASNPLCDFIRAAESPAHSDLSSDRQQFKLLYYGGQALLKYVCDLMFVLASSFTDVSGKEDKDALADYFSIDVDDPRGEDNRKRKRRRGKKRGNADKPKNSIPHKPAFFKIWDRWPQGVKITNDNPPDALPRRILATMAYTVDGDADPVKRYDLADFDCRKKGNVTVTCTGCSPVKQEPNRVTFEITEPEFTIEMTGFDSKRDVYVDVREIKPKQSAESAADAPAAFEEEVDA